MTAFSKKKLPFMSSEDFVKNLEIYKSLKDNNYKPNIRPIIRDFLLACSPILLLWFFQLFVVNSISAEKYISSSHYLVLIAATLASVQIVFFIHFIVNAKHRMLKYDDLFRVKSNIEESLFKGDLCEIFNKECSVTRSIINQNKENLTDDVCEYKALSGELILDLFVEIEKEKTKQKEIEVMISCNTRSGKILKDINEFSL